MTPTTMEDETVAEEITNVVVVAETTTTRYTEKEMQPAQISEGTVGHMEPVPIAAIDAGILQMDIGIKQPSKIR